MQHSRRLCFDIETDGIDSPSQLHCVCVHDLDNPSIRKEFFGEVSSYASELLALFGNALIIVGHNIIDYDLRWLEVFVPGFRIDKSKVVDTLVLSRLLWQDRPGGHSLEAWGERFKYPKPSIEDFSKFTPELLHRCHTDVEINAKLYHHLLKKLDAPNWHEAVKLELEYQWIAREMHDNGFYFNIEDAVAMRAELDDEVAMLDAQIQAAFPPTVKITELKTKTKKFILEDPTSCRLKIPSIKRDICASIMSATGKRLKRDHEADISPITKRIRNDDGNIIEIIESGISLNQKSGITLTLKELENSDARLLTDYILESLIECSISREVAAQFVAKTNHLWSIIVTKTGMCVDFYAAPVTYTLDGTNLFELLQRGISRQQKIEEIPFNPASPKQLVDRLWEGGWKPTERTKGHSQALKDKSTPKERLANYKRYGWKVNEANVGTLPDDADPAYQLLVDRLLVDARRRTLTEWIDAYNPTTRRIHGRFNPLGTRTQRCVHTNPNMGNVPTKKSIKYNSTRLREKALKFGARMRSMWQASPSGALLVGTDMESAHLRIFAHLINDSRFIQALVSGKKEDGTDPHTLNRRALGEICVDRDRAKTFIFTFLNGGGAGKVAEIFGCSAGAARDALGRFIASYPGLAELRERQIPKDAARGYFEGVDGRYVINDSEHHMIGFYLQNSEAVIMKTAHVEIRKRLDRLGIKYKFVNFVHDELVTEVYGDKATAELVGKIQAECISWAGEKYALNCPLAGESKVGHTWLDVH